MERVTETTVAATFCATLVDEWVRAGVTLACVAPGSRSTPLALALAADGRIEVAVFTDERSAGFAALGHGLAAGRPAVALCTSGTAATHFHGAVVEADLSSVPMIVCTADRPPELWDLGAPQTIDQTRLYGPSVRFFAQPGVPDAATADTWRPLASRLVAEASGWSQRPGPVQANLSFRDPLVGTPGELPTGRPGGAPWYEVVPSRATAGLDENDEIAALEAIRVALSEVSDGGTYVWRRQHGRLSGIVQPTVSFKNAAGRVCRRILLIMTVGTATGRTEGVACRLPDGRWQLDG